MMVVVVVVAVLVAMCGAEKLPPRFGVFRKGNPLSVMMIVMVMVMVMVIVMVMVKLKDYLLALGSVGGVIH
jgi:uncharacterized membrane protein YidH (DUF202 family)